MNSSKVLANELHESRKKFEIARSMGIVGGEFDATTWRYRSRRIHFTFIGGREPKGTPLPGDSASLARTFIVNQIHGKPNFSAELVLGRVIAFRYLASVMERHGWHWTKIGAAQLNRVLEVMREDYSEATTYHRAGGLVAIVHYLNGVRTGRGLAEERFLDRHLSWKHGIANPIRAMQDVTSVARELQHEKKYVEDLPQALAKVRAQLLNDPSLEPRPGYDRMRLEALAFVLALGLRCGEVTALPVHALDDESVPGSLFLRVPVEKAGTANAMPVPSVWDAVVREAYFYLIEACAGARAQARIIERQGFEFISQELQRSRTQNPLSGGQSAQLKLANLDPINHFTISEVVKCFELSEKQFSSSGRYSEALVGVPKPLASRIVEWIDLRVERWDWLSYSRKKLRRDAYTFGITDLALAIGARPGNISKQHVFVDELKDFLRKLSDAGCFSPASTIAPAQIEEWKTAWKHVRQLVISNTGGAHGSVVDIAEFKRLLHLQFTGYLGRHFDELVAEDDDEVAIASPLGSGSPQARTPRPGMERNLSSHLIVLWDGQFSSNRPLGIVPRPLFRADIYNYLRTNSLKSTVFQRLGVRDASGKVFSFSPHMIRHWVTTAMLRSGPNELAVDLWMNRAPRQGHHYDHRTAKERAEHVRKLYLQSEPPNDYLGRRVAEWKVSGIGNDEIAKLIEEKLRVVHFTPWGSCSRDLYTSPCSKGLMCIRGFGTGSECSSFQIDPENEDARTRIEKLLHDYQRMMNVLEPRQEMVSDALIAELDSSEPLDQHLRYIIDVIRGCRNALNAYGIEGT